MIPSRTFRVLFLASMFASMAVVLAWAGWIGWREWPEWRAVREMRAAVEANEPGRFLDAIEQVDSLGVAEAAAEEIAPLRQHPDPRVRMYAVMARTVLGPRGPAEAKELIELIDDPDEEIDVRCVGFLGLVVHEPELIIQRLPLFLKMWPAADPRGHRILGQLCFPPAADVGRLHKAAWLVMVADDKNVDPFAAWLERHLTSP